MEVLYPRCAGLDVHKDTVVACVRIAAEDHAQTEVRTSAWCMDQGCGCTDPSPAWGQATQT